MYTSAKTRKKRRHVGPTCLKIPGENTDIINMHHTQLSARTHKVSEQHTTVQYRVFRKLTLLANLFLLRMFLHTFQSIGIDYVW